MSGTKKIEIDSDRLKLLLPPDDKPMTNKARCQELLAFAVAELSGAAVALASIVEEVKAMADALCAMVEDDDDQRGSEETGVA